MPIKQRLMGSGFSAQQAVNAVGDTALAISAAGNSYATATVLSSAINIVSTVSASQGVVLPACDIGDEVVVANTSGTTLTVYPDGSSSSTIDGGASASLITVTRKKFIKVGATSWYS